MPFSILVRANEFYPSVKDEEKIFIQGIVDVLFEENGELVLVDYKTDRTGTKKSLLDKYSLQINVYARAIQQIMGRTIKEKYLYLFQQGEAVPVEE
jgi:ATP-dependent helicase/nuclease subunit A